MTSLQTLSQCTVVSGTREPRHGRGFLPEPPATIPPSRPGARRYGGLLHGIFYSNHRYGGRWQASGHGALWLSMNPLPGLHCSVVSRLWTSLQTWCGYLHILQVRVPSTPASGERHGRSREVRQVTRQEGGTPVPWTQWSAR